jgi:hypothetical protein
MAPPKIYFVDAFAGSDENTGLDAASAFKTIAKASSVLEPSGSVYILPGIYRERVVPPCDGVSYIGYSTTEFNPAIVRGSVQWTPSASGSGSADIWNGLLDTVRFPDNSQVDGANPFDVPMCVTPYGKNGAPEYANGDKTADPDLNYCLGAVFDLSNNLLIQQGKYADMAACPGSWYYDRATGVLYIHYAADRTSGEAVEIVNQRRLFAPHKRGLKNVVVKNLVFERCGNQYPNKFWTIAANQQAGAVGTRSGRGWTVQDCTIRWATGVGIDFGNEGSSNQDLELGSSMAPSQTVAQSSGHTIIGCRIEYNGAAGTAAYMVKNTTFSNNVVRYNNSLQFYGKQRWESAGIKIHRPTGCVFANNRVEHNWCHGMWCDQGAGTGSTVQSNTFAENAGAGINFEIGQQTSMSVSLNTFAGNETGITFVTSGGVTVENNVFDGSKKVDIEVVLFSRPNDKWDSDNLRIYANRFGDKSPMYYKLTANDPAIPARRFLRDNQYACDKRFSIVSGKNVTTYTFDQWRAYWALANNGVDAETNSRSMA